MRLFFKPRLPISAANSLRTSLTVLLGICVVALSPCHAQTIQFDGATTSIPDRFVEGRDFASTVLGDPWDMANMADLGWERCRTSSLNDGVYRAVSGDIGAWFMPLVAGFSTSTLWTPLPGDRDLPTWGRLKPVDATTFTVLSYRLRASDPTTTAIRWKRGFSSGADDHWPDEGGLAVDAYATPSAFFRWNRWKLYHFDLGHTGQAFAHIDGEWGGQVTGLAILPSINAPEGSSYSVDWVRLADPSSAPVMSVGWAVSGGWSGGAEPAATVLVYPASGDPMVYASVTGPDAMKGRIDIPGAVFPPGQYRFEVVLHRPGADEQPVSSTGLSRAFTVLAGPRAIIRSPGPQGGRDFSLVSGNPWDMESQDDVANLRDGVSQKQRQFTAPVMQNGIFSAEAEAPYSGFANSDVQVQLSVPSSTPIDPRRYRYAIVRMKVSEQGELNYEDWLSAGLVSRIIWWDKTFATRGVTGDIVLRRGMNSYVVDLNEVFVEEGSAWTSFDAIRHFRLDPMESVAPRAFSIDSVELRAEPEAPVGQEFPIVLDVSDEDLSGAVLSVVLREKGTANETMLIAGQHVGSGTVQLLWTPRPEDAEKVFEVRASIATDSWTSRVIGDTPIRVVGQKIAEEGKPSVVATTPVFGGGARCEAWKARNGRVSVRATPGVPAERNRMIVTATVRVKGRLFAKFALRPQADGSYKGQTRREVRVSSRRMNTVQATSESAGVRTKCKNVAS